MGIDWKQAATITAGILLAALLLAVVGGVARKAG